MHLRSNHDAAIAYLPDGQLESVTTRTPLDELIEAEEELGCLEFDSAERLEQIPADAVLTILRFLIPTHRPDVIRNAKRWDAAQIRLIVLAHAAGLEGVADRSLASIAEEVGCTRALLSLYATRMIDELGQEAVRGGKCRSSRTTYRASATDYHKRAGHRMSQPS